MFIICIAFLAVQLVTHSTAFQRLVLLRNRLWATLGRKGKSGAQQHRSSFIAQPNPTIVPGGRFLETYYWDTYWVVCGLLVCNMLETAKGVVENLLDLWPNQSENRLCMVMQLCRPKIYFQNLSGGMCILYIYIYI